MAMSSITVAGITPTLSILGSFQEFIYNQNTSAFRLYNTFVPVISIPAETNFEYRNNTLSGFRWTHTTNTTDTIGQLKLQSFTLASANGTDVLSINNDNTITFYNPVSIPTIIISDDLDMNGNKIIELAEGTSGTDAVNLDQLTDVLNQAVLKTGSEMTGPLVLSGDPVEDMEAATKGYVDDLIANSDFKTPCYAASTVNLSAIYDNGTSGVGATLTNNGAYVEFTIDGVTVAQNDRVLIKNQSSPAQNGIYIVTSTGTIITPWVLTRSVDYDSSTEITKGNTISIEYGTVNNRTTWIQSTSVSAIGTDPISFYQFGYNPSTFLQRVNNLSDLNNTTTSRLNLGLTDIAIQQVTENSVLLGGPSNTMVSLFGTTGQLLVSNGVSNQPSFQTYNGTSSINTLGTITTGTWNADIISPTYGGTGIDNGNNTITLDGNLTTSGANDLTLTTTGTTNITLPITGTLVNTDVTTLSNLSSIGTITTGTWNADIINPVYGGTGINNGSNTITLGGNLVTSGANSLTLTTTGLTNVTLPITGTLVNTDVTTLSNLSSIGTITTGTWNADVINVIYGGTGKASFNNHSLLVGDGTSSIGEIAAASTGTVLIGQTGSDPIFSNAPIVSSITINNNPISSTDGVNKGYVDALVAGLDFKEVCYAATTANLNAIYNNGSLGVGATLTNNGALVAFTIDGQNPSIGQRILIKNQTSTLQNGIYNLTVVGDGATAWVLTRSSDYDSSKDITPGNLIPVEYGNTNSVSSWIQTSTIGEFGVGVDPINFTPFTYNPTSFLEVANNLSDLNNPATARINLGLTNIATQSVSTDNVLIGGSSNSIVSLPLTNGQLLIGSTGNSPIAAVPTNGTNISWVTGAGSLTANITGQISLTNGGTNASLVASNGGIFYSNASAGAILAGTAIANKLLMSGANSAPNWSVATYPSSTTINQILYSSDTNVVSGITTVNNGTLITSGAGVPSISSTLPTAVQTNITSLGTITTGTWNGNAITVGYGGTGLTSTTAYGVICGGTTSTAALQNVGTGTAGQILTSNGASALPSWQAIPTAASKSYGSMYRPTNSTSTSSAGFTLIPGTGVFTAGLLNNFTFNGSKRLTYTGATSAFFNLIGTSFEQGASGTKYYVFAKNGSIITATEMRVETTNQTTIGNITFTGIVELTTNDYIEVYVRAVNGVGSCLPATTTVVIEQIS